MNHSDANQIRRPACCAAVCLAAQYRGDSHACPPGVCAHPDRAIPADGFRSLAAAIEASRQRFRESQLERLIPLAFGTLCPICVGGGRQEIDRGFGLTPIVQKCVCDGGRA